MQKIAAKLIKPDQTGFIPLRQGAKNIRTINIISTAQKNKQTSLIISLDAEHFANSKHP